MIKDGTYDLIKEVKNGKELEKLCKTILGTDIIKDITKNKIWQDAYNYFIKREIIPEILNKEILIFKLNAAFLEHLRNIESTDEIKFIKVKEKINHKWLAKTETYQLTEDKDFEVDFDGLNEGITIRNKFDKDSIYIRNEYFIAIYELAKEKKWFERWNKDEKK